MGYREFLEQQTADWEKISEELRAQEEHADRIYEHNGRVLNTCTWVGGLIIVTAAAAWVFTGDHEWAYASLIAPLVVLFGYPIFKKDYD